MARSKPERIGKTYRRRANAAGVVSTSLRGNGARWRVATTWAPSLDAVALVDHVSDVIMAEHHHAIGEGRQADGQNVQPPLADYGRAGRDAAEGKRPKARGYTGKTAKPFRDNIERSAIKVKGKQRNRSRIKQGSGALRGQSFLVNETVEGTKATTTIRPDKIHANFLALEDKRGIRYFYVKGMVADAIDRAVAKWADVALEGALKQADKRDRKARKAKTL
jgi:hypothetical protein